MKNGQKSFTQNIARIATPPMKWLAAINFSAAKLRSANWLLKNMAVSEAIANALFTHVLCQPSK